MEVGRNPRPADSPQRRVLHLVARRGPRDGALSGNRLRCAAFCRMGWCWTVSSSRGKTARCSHSQPLQQRIGRKKILAGILASVPVHFLAYDLLEENHEDLRALPMRERRARLEALLRSAESAIGLSPLVHAATWEELADAAHRIPLAQRRRADAQGAGFPVRHRPATGLLVEVEDRAVLVRCGDALCASRTRQAVQSVHRLYVRRLGWRPAGAGGQGLFGAQQRRDPRAGSLDPCAHDGRSSAPCRSVEPTQVFELAYEGIAASSRHKSGIALRFPRILRPRPDKPASEANTLVDLQAVLKAHSAG